MTLHFIYFLGIINYLNFEKYLNVYGRTEAAIDTVLLSKYKEVFVKLGAAAKERFFTKLNSEDFYFFIISKKQLDNFNDYMDMYGMKPYIHYTKNDIPNVQYSDERRLNIFIFKFDEEYVAKWK